MSIVPKSDNQRLLLEAIAGSAVTFAIGPAGSGKTFVAVNSAIDALLAGKKTLYFARPAVSASKSVGLLPGLLEEKLYHWMRPVLMLLEERVGAQDLEKLIKKKKVNLMAFEHMRGLTFDSAFVFLDEAQLTTPEEMKTFLTRIGDYTKFVVAGDLDQQEFSRLSGLEDALIVNPGFPVIQFTEDDCVRSEACKRWVKAYKERIK